MTIVEEMAINQLTEFVETAKEMGICYHGSDIDKDLQLAVVSIVEQYVGEYLEEVGQ